MTTRKKTDRSPSRAAAEREWFDAGAAAMRAEVAKLRGEAKYFAEEIARLKYERMERETWDRARRTYDFVDDVDDASAYELIANLSDWAAESDEPMLLRIMTNGGDETAGFAIIDYVRALRAQGITVDTLVMGQAASMGSLLVQCGETRYAMPNSVLLIHEARTFYETPWMEKITDNEDRIKLGWMLEKMGDAILAERSVFTPEQLREEYARRDWWMTASEAREHGFLDELWEGQR
jgi:ATP-dependent Clp endopeptidase proteolytic subunit ClpP